MKTHDRARSMAPSTLAWLLAASVIGCSARGGSDLVVGALVARTGDRALWGEDLFHGIELAVEHANVRGGVLGRRVRLVDLDDASRDEHAGPLVAQLCDHSAPIAVLGELSTPACERGAQAAQRRGVPFIGVANTARDISRSGDAVFRTALTDAEIASALARYVRTVLQRRRAAVIYRRSSLTELDLADAFAQTFRSAGGEVVLRDGYEGEEAEMIRLAGRIRSAGADVVFAPADASDAARVAVALRHGHVNAQLVGNDGWFSPELRRLAADTVNGALLADPFVVTDRRPEVEQFVRSFREKYHATPGTFAALGFDATQWLLATAARVPSLEPRAIRDALAGSRLDEAVAGPFGVDARRVLSRTVQVLRIDPTGLLRVGASAP